MGMFSVIGRVRLEPSGSSNVSSDDGVVVASFLGVTGLLVWGEVGLSVL